MQDISGVSKIKIWVICWLVVETISRTHIALILWYYCSWKFAIVNTLGGLLGIIIISFGLQSYAFLTIYCSTNMYTFGLWEQTGGADYFIPMFKNNSSSYDGFKKWVTINWYFYVIFNYGGGSAIWLYCRNFVSGTNTSIVGMLLTSNIAVWVFNLIKPLSVIIWYLCVYEL